jgi:hypothetical protein
MARSSAQSTKEVTAVNTDILEGPLEPQSSIVKGS